MAEASWSRAAIGTWVFIWLVLDVLVFAVLSGEQGWWAMLLIIVGNGLVAALAIEVVRRVRRVRRGGAG